ncbi:nitrite reductase (NAD(P)H) [Paenibacillus terrae HPL-003]|uniref:Nitrite reductase (NAD(P)H) n=1 Tax=Paenibacillus terrae (strain HPL-003) TaxID=985665 RepID=G7VPE6_PAETH|nr:nitrite reductase large subunit NirB [Paenibacillus terrae]AET61667.1 nitrite reductase (NAD(P)H) [Paenibacillus terrae HPL-003]
MVKKLVIVGNGMAGIKCVEEILDLEPDQFQITIFGAEPRPGYNRVLLSKMLQDESSFEHIVTHNWAWYEENGVRLYAGERVCNFDIAARTVETETGIKEPYDMLILATGSLPFIPPIPGARKRGVIAFRDASDCETMAEYAQTYEKATVIGGGLLGLEAAQGLLNLGKEVGVVHNAQYLMNRQLDQTAAALLQRELEQQGMWFHLAKKTVNIMGRNRVRGLMFSDGNRLETDLVVLAVGIRPNIELVQGSGLKVNHAIVVDDYMRTSIPDIYAVGECAEHCGISYGLVAPLYEQCKVLAKVICGRETTPYEGSIPYAQLKVAGIHVFSAGNIREEGNETAVMEYDGMRGIYKKVMMRNGAVTGAILFGDTAESTSLLGMVRRGAPTTELASQDRGVSRAEEAAAALPEEETVCACNGVSKGTILRAITTDKLKTVEEVKSRTKASASCGGCRPLVAALVKNGLSRSTVSEAVVTLTDQEVVPVCGCTHYDHDSLKTAMVAAVCRTPAEVVSRLGWTRQQGCELCRPAVLYYLESLGLREISASSQLAGDVAIQTTAQHGGEPVSASLRFVNFMGLNGESQLFSESNQIGGEAWVEAVRLKERLSAVWGSRALPAPIAVAVCPGPEYPGGVLVRDIGLSRSPAGWEVYAGGHAEHPVRQGRLLGVEENAEEALLMAIACLQMYRHNARYGEKMWEWIERTDVLVLRESVLDAALRSGLAGMAGSLRDYNSDRVTG